MAPSQQTHSGLTRRSLGVVGLLSLTGPLARPPVVDASPLAQATWSGVVALGGTPHLWLGDDTYTLHWLGDTRVLGGRSPAQHARWVATLDELRTFRRGDPWLSAGFVALGDALYLARWDADQSRPTLLHVQSLADLELFGVDGSNYHRFVLTQAEWERRYDLNAGALPRGELSPAAQVPPARRQAAVVELEGGGSFTIELLPDRAPLAVENFLSKARSDFYAGLTFHRDEDWIVQGGDPSGDGTGGQRTLALELNSCPFDAGAVGMARGWPPIPTLESMNNDAQFFICRQRAPHVDRNYTCFGYLTDGWDTVWNLRRGTRIQRVLAVT